jgi:plastocyanin
MHGRMLRAGFAAATAVVASLLLGAPPAVAGGGCHAQPTEGSGDTVTMVKACFRPSVLRVEPGAEVTFFNRDPIVHNVSANGWGEFADIDQGDRFTATFPEAGVYPFACTYHPGMVGSIVVGDGTTAGAGDTVSMRFGSAEDASASAALEAGSWSPAAWLGAAGGVVVGIGLGALAMRRRRT